MTNFPATGLVGHQDYGTGLDSGADRDPTAAAYFAAGDAAIDAHVLAGISLTYDDTDITVANGAALLKFDGSVAVPSQPTDAATDYTEAWHGPIAFPVSVDATSFSPPAPAGINHIFLTVNPSANNAVAYEVFTDEATTPTNPSLKIGIVDAGASEVTELNREAAVAYANDADTVDGKHASELGGNPDEVQQESLIHSQGFFPDFLG